MERLPEILNAFEQALELERELGTRTVAIDRARAQFALKLQHLLERRQDFRETLHVCFFDIRHPSPDIPY